jgi:hypothetical protein
MDGDKIRSEIMTFPNQIDHLKSFFNREVWYYKDEDDSYLSKYKNDLFGKIHTLRLKLQSMEKSFLQIEANFKD